MGDTVDRILNMGFDAVYQERTANALNQGEKYTFMYRLRLFLQSKFGVHLGLNKTDFSMCYKYLVSDEVYKNNVYPTLVAGYDRSPRAGKNAQLFYNFTPDTWKAHVRDLLRRIEGKDAEYNFVFLKSWNEWGESNYMEPDIKYGTSLLDILKEEITKIG